MQETWVWFLGGEDPLEKEMATHSSILAWKFPQPEGAWQATVHGVAKSWTWPRTTRTRFAWHLSYQKLSICIKYNTCFLKKHNKMRYALQKTVNHAHTLMVILFSSFTYLYFQNSLWCIIILIRKNSEMKAKNINHLHRGFVPDIWQFYLHVGLGQESTYASAKTFLWKSTWVQYSLQSEWFYIGYPKA